MGIHSGRWVNLDLPAAYGLVVDGAVYLRRAVLGVTITMARAFEKKQGSKPFSPARLTARLAYAAISSCD